MTGRERVAAAMRFAPPDRAPLQYYYTPVGVFEHGERLNDLYRDHPGDFEPFRRMPVPCPPPEEYDQSGRYHAFRTDEWGVTWEYRIFGVAGIPFRRPLEDLDRLPDYRLPGPPLPGNAAFAEIRKRCQELHAGGYYAQIGCGGIYERLLSLCGDENVLCGIALEDPALNDLADRIAGHCRACVEAAVAAGADGVALGDDYGTERGMIMAPNTWRRFFAPRLSHILQPAVQAGLTVQFHSCGKVGEILPDLAALGVNAVWPQIPAYDMAELAALCRELRLAVVIHTDRARTMTTGTPGQVRELVKREVETFRVAEGGAWFYVEADNGFPFENLKALVEAIAEYR